MNELAPTCTTGLKGYALVSVINPDGSVALELPPIRNLWVDQGLDALADMFIADAFNVCCKGTGQVATKEVPHTSNTYTLAGSTVTRNTSPGTPRDFTADDVGKLIRSADSKECMIAAFTDATHVDVVGVGLNTLSTFAAQHITFYSVSLKALTAEDSCTFSVETISKTDGNATVTATGAAFVSTDVGRAIFVGGDPGDPYAERYKIVTYISATQITVNRTAGEFTGRRLVVYTPQAGDVTLTPISRTSIYSGVLAENGMTDTAVDGVLTGERVLFRTFIFSPEPEYIEYKASDDAGTFTWNGTGVTRTAGARNFTTADVGKYLKFSTNEFCKITSRTSNTVVVVDRAPAATLTNDVILALYGFRSYDGIAFSNSDDPDANANIIVRLESAGVDTPVLLMGVNPEFPGQQLKVTYRCSVTVGPVVATARAVANISDPTHAMSSNKFGQSVVEGLAISSIDSTGVTTANFAVLEPFMAGFVALSTAPNPLQPLALFNRGSAAVSTVMVAVGYTPGDFSQLYLGTFGINDAIGAAWKSLGIFDADQAAFAFTWLFEAAQAKTGQIILTIRFRKTWNRDLS